MKKSSALVSFAVLVLIAACHNPVGSDGGDTTFMEPGTGVITFRFASGSTAQTIAPPITLERGYYEIEGSGPGGASFDPIRIEAGEPAEETVTVVVGEWTVTVNAYNEAGQLVGSGTAAVTVEEGETAEAPVTIQSIEGSGTLSFTINGANGGGSPLTAEAELISESGDESSLLVSGGGSSRTVTQPVDAGTYVLAVRLRDGGTTVAGFAEILWIVAEETTSFSAAIDRNNGGVTISGDGDAAPKKNVTVSISGLPAGPISAGDSVVVTANVAGAGSSDVTWYLNGEQDGSGTGYTIDAGLAPGAYTLSAVAFENNGSGAGSRSIGFVVEEPVAVGDFAVVIYDN